MTTPGPTSQDAILKSLISSSAELSSLPQTLAQVGLQFGVTKERIRQLEGRALRKLRQIAQEEKLDIPGI